MKITELYKILENKVLKFIAVFIFFLLFNLLIPKIFFNSKIDLTADKLFTVSQNTKEILTNISEPIDIKLFFSNSLSKDLSQIRNYEKRVKELLLNYETISKGNIKLELIDPKPFTDQEDLANVYGIQGLQINEEGERFYFGASFSNSVDSNNCS